MSDVDDASGGMGSPGADGSHADGSHDADDAGAVNRSHAAATSHDASPAADADSREGTVTRIYAAMRHLVLDSDDRRREVVEATGMGFGRSRALRRLLAGPLGMSDLASRLTTDRPYTTLIVDDLERRRLVVRTVAPEDRRAKVVTLTDAGRALARQAEEILARPPEALTRLDAEDLAALDRLLAKLAG